MYRDGPPFLRDQELRNLLDHSTSEGSSWPDKAMGYYGCPLVGSRRAAPSQESSGHVLVTSDRGHNIDQNRRPGQSARRLGSPVQS
jgi:hypothetical protein